MHGKKITVNKIKINDKIENICNVYHHAPKIKGKKYHLTRRRMNLYSFNRKRNANGSSTYEKMLNLTHNKRKENLKYIEMTFLIYQLGQKPKSFTACSVGKAVGRQSFLNTAIERQSDQTYR